MQHLVTERHLEIAQWALACFPLPRADSSHTMPRMRVERRRRAGYGGDPMSATKAHHQSAWQVEIIVEDTGASRIITGLGKRQDHPTLCYFAPLARPPLARRGSGKRNKLTNARRPTNTRARVGVEGGLTEEKDKNNESRRHCLIPQLPPSAWLPLSSLPTAQLTSRGRSSRARTSSRRQNEMGR